MALERYANLPVPSTPGVAWTTLNGGINNSVTTVVVSGNSMFPSAAQYRIRIDDEIMLVTAGGGTDSWTVTRGAEGTTAASHSNGAGVFGVLTAAGLLNNPLALTTSGDIPYLNSSLNQARLAAPVDGDYVWRWSSAVPSYTATPVLTSLGLGNAPERSGTLLELRTGGSSLTTGAAYLAISGTANSPQYLSAINTSFSTDLNDGMRLGQGTTGIGYLDNGMGTASSSSRGARLQMDYPNRQVQIFPAGTSAGYMQAEMAIAAGGTDYTDFRLTLFGQQGTGAVSNYFSTQINLAAEEVGHATGATCYGIISDGTWTSGGGFGSNTQFLLFDQVNTRNILRHVQSDAMLFEVALGLQVSGRITTAGSPPASGTILGSNVIPTINKSTATSVTYAAAQIKPTLNFTGSNANTTMVGLNIDTTNTSVTGFTSANMQLLRMYYGGTQVMTVLGNGDVQLRGPANTSVALIQPYSTSSFAAVSIWPEGNSTGGYIRFYTSPDVGTDHTTAALHLAGRTGTDTNQGANYFNSQVRFATIDPSFNEAYAYAFVGEGNWVSPTYSQARIALWSNIESKTLWYYDLTDANHFKFGGSGAVVDVRLQNGIIRADGLTTTAGTPPADGTVLGAQFTSTINKSTATSVTYPVVKIYPTLNFTGSNSASIVNVLHIDTANTSVTGLSAAQTRLIEAQYGGLTRVRLQRDGEFVVNTNATMPSTTLYAPAFSLAGFEVHGPDAGQAFCGFVSYGNQSTITMVRVNSTLGSPTDVADTNQLGSIGWAGLANGAYTGNKASINGIAYGAWGSGSQGAGILFRTTANGGTTTNEKMRFTDVGNLKIGPSSDLTSVRATTEGTNHLDIFNGTAPVGALTNGISIYSASGECRVMDSAGNSTLLSPHDRATNEWIFYSKNTVTGQVLRIDMERLMRFLDGHFGGGYVHDYLEAAA